MLIYVNAIGRMEAVQCHQIAGANVNIILGFMTLSFDFFDFLIKELCMENNGESDRLIQFHQKGNRVPENGIWNDREKENKNGGHSISSKSMAVK